MSMVYTQPNLARLYGFRPAHGGDQVLVYKNANNGGSTQMYQSPPNGHLYICSCWITANNISGATDGGIKILESDGSTEYVRLLYQQFESGLTSTNSMTFFYPVEVPSNYYVVLVSGSESIYGFIQGWVE